MEVVQITNDEKKPEIVGESGMIVVDPAIPEEMQKVILEDESIAALSSTTTVVGREDAVPAMRVKQVHGPDGAKTAEGDYGTEVSEVDPSV